ncbi:MAG: penicillin acylase family protein [Alphaproteobacteria bacterium]|jgi:penicillin amidase|nr:penicillin acylase family protein [Alphaproteobacteria bacterium]
MTWFWRAFGGLILFTAIVAASLYLWLRGTLPAVDGSIQVVGSEAPIEIVRDRNGVPHIFAQSRGDALFGLGFAHAQDRLWQMEMTRRLGAGRLAEVLGEQAIRTDRFMRTLDLHGLAAEGYRRLDPDQKRLIDAYVAGVNALLAESGTRPMPEFIMLRYQPEQWTPADSLVWVKLMALDLSTNWSAELLRLRLAKRLDRQQIDELYRPYDGTEPRGPDLSAALAAPISTAVLDGLLALGPPAAREGIGSNNWAVSGSRTANGRPLLANDPHLALRAPAIWYFAHLSWQGRDLIGATLPGLPTVVLGHNKRIAWSFSNTGTDVQDLYLEKLMPGDPSRYLTPAGAREFGLRKEVIRVKDGADVTMTIRRSRHGPVLSDALDLPVGAVEAGHVLALAWTALAEDDTTVRSGFGMALAQDWKTFVEALSEYHVPQQNVIYADVEGNIGFITPGRVPRRKPENEIQGFVPQPGWESRYDWDGFVPFEALPRLLNPPSGMLVSANHKIVSDDYPHHLTFEWAHGYRAQRIAEMLAGRPRHSIESFKAMQLDTVSLMARELLPTLLDAEAGTDLARQAKAMLETWDGRMELNRPEPLIFAVWYRELTRLIYADELGPLFSRAWGQRARFVKFVIQGEGGAWCDEVATPAPEACADLLGRSLDRAVAWIAERYGDDAMKWRWGEAHKARGRHLPFSEVDQLARFFETEVATSGGSYTVNVGHYAINNARDPFANIHAPSMRAIYDLDDLDRSIFILSTGQSGNPLSPLYDNLVEPWARGTYISMSTLRRDIEVGALGRLMLLPDR